MGIDNIDALKPDQPEKFIICPDCNGESNRDVNVKCGTCGCAGIIPKPLFTGVTVLKDLRTGDFRDKGRELSLTEQQKAELTYPNHSPEAALANYRAGHEVWDTNGDLW